MTAVATQDGQFRGLRPVDIRTMTLVVQELAPALDARRQGLRGQEAAALERCAALLWSLGVSADPPAIEMVAWLEQHRLPSHRQEIRPGVRALRSTDSAEDDDAA